MSSLANHFMSAVQKWEAIANQPMMHARFEDDTVLQISLDGNNKKLGTNDGPGTMANQFGESLKPGSGFQIEVNKLVFTFKDDSVLEVGLDGSTLYLS